MYSSGNSLPSYVFDAHYSNEQHPEKNQLSFLMKGEHAFTRAFELAKNVDEHDQDKKRLVAAAAIDLGTNLLSQASVLLLALGEGSGDKGSKNSSNANRTSSQINNLIARSVNAYLYAVDISPHEA